MRKGRNVSVVVVRRGRALGTGERSVKNPWGFGGDTGAEQDTGTAALT